MLLVFLHFIVAFFCELLSLVSLLSWPRVLRGDVGVSSHGWSAAWRQLVQLVLELRRQMLSFRLSPEYRKKDVSFLFSVAFYAAAEEKRNWGSDLFPCVAELRLNFAIAIVMLYLI